MKQCTYSVSSTHEVVVLENILLDHVRRGMFEGMTVVLYHILPNDVIRHICDMAYPFARCARWGIGEGEEVFEIEYADDLTTTFYRAYS